MPGIAGIVGRDSAEGNESALDAMVSRMMHEEFYASGTYINTRLGSSIGWACRKESYSDCLPVWNDREDICLVVLGDSVLAESIAGGATDRRGIPSCPDPRRIIARYEEAGDRVLEELNGWFSGVLLDLRREHVVLFNDRYGLGRIYYHESDSLFYFASEAKSLLAVLPHLRQLDTKSLGEHFSCGCVLQNRTLFRGISILPGGAMWTFLPDRTVEKKSYFQCSDWENQDRLGEKEYYDSIRDVFSRTLPHYFLGEQQVALSLTGGLDSRMIMACSPKASGNLPCYSFGGMYRDCKDVNVAREVARVCEQPFDVLRMDSALISGFPELAEKTVYLTDGSMDVSGAVELHANALARMVAPVRMTGNYGSEILRRNVAFRPTRPCEDLFDPEFFTHIDSAALTYAEEASGHPLSFIAFKQVPWHHYGRLAVEQSQLTLRTPYLDNELVKLAYRAPPELTTGPELQLRFVADCHPALGKIGTDRGYLARPVPVVSRLNRKLQDLTAKAEYAYDYGMPQWLVKMDKFLGRAHLEKLFLGHHKFYHFRIWYRDKLSGYLKEILLDSRSRSRSYLKKDFVETMVQDHVNGRRNYTLELHKVLTCELLHRRLLEQS